MGTSFKNRLFCSSVQKSITGSTMARLYQLRSKRTISPADGRCWIYLWKYHWVCSVSSGATSATTRVPRGFICSIILLIVPPLPAASRPSNNANMRNPSVLTCFCIFKSSICSLCNSCSYLRVNSFTQTALRFFFFFLSLFLKAVCSDNFFFSFLGFFLTFSLISFFALDESFSLTGIGFAFFGFTPLDLFLFSFAIFSLLWSGIDYWKLTIGHSTFVLPFGSCQGFAIFFLLFFH